MAMTNTPSKFCESRGSIPKGTYATKASVHFISFAFHGILFSLFHPQGLRISKT